MNSHWSDNDSIELLRISINNYPKFDHLKKNCDPDKFFDDRIFSKYHNLGRNGKSIKNRIETVQKKFRKNVRNMDVNKFKDGIIEDDMYTTSATRELFNTSFEFERLFGRYCGSKELMRKIELVCHSEYWSNNRKRIHPRWNKRLSNHSSSEDLNKASNHCQVQNPIVISSAESSGSEDLNTFRDVDFVVNRKRKICRDYNLSKIVLSPELSYDKKINSTVFPKLRILENKLSTDLDNDYIPVSLHQITKQTQTNDIKDCHPSVKNVSVMTEVTNTLDKECCTGDALKNLSYSEIKFTEITPLEGFDSSVTDNPLCRTIIATFAPMVAEVSSLHSSLKDISESLRQLVQIMLPSTTSK